MAVLILGDEPTSSMRVEEDSIFLSAISISNYLEHSLSSPKTNSAVHDVTNGKFVTPRYPRPNIVTFLTHTAKLRYKPIFSQLYFVLNCHDDVNLMHNS